jgi:hypothetical protein
MWLKVIIIILFIALVLSLFSSLGYLFKDRGLEQPSRRTWNTLSIRLILTALLFGFIFYGVFTGQLGSAPPWDSRHPSNNTESRQP